MTGRMATTKQGSSNGILIIVPLRLEGVVNQRFTSRFGIGFAGPMRPCRENRASTCYSGLVALPKTWRGDNRNINCKPPPFR